MVLGLLGLDYCLVCWYDCFVCVVFVYLVCFIVGFELMAMDVCC